MEIAKLSSIGWDDLRKQVELRTVQSMLAELEDEETGLQERLGFVQQQKDSLKRKSELLGGAASGSEGQGNMKETKVVPSDADLPEKSGQRGDMKKKMKTGC